MAGHRSDMRKLLNRAEKQGCTVERTGGGHWRITTPSGKKIVTSFSPKNAGAYRVTIRALKKEGLDL
jgi:predicted RNA binding protein YcfA (HicA-like mRNA interferase family)